MSLRRKILYTIAACLAMCAVLALFAGWYIGLHDLGINFDFDPARLAASETRMWQYYYARDGESMALEMISLLREQFGASLKTAYGIVEPMARGTMAFGRGQHDVLPYLEQSYERLAEACDRPWNARELAEAELAWWVARRTPGQDSAEQVGAKIAHLYALMYGETNAAIERAGLLRAQAAALRDTGRRNADWLGVERLLRDSYTALRDGIRAGR